MRSLPIPRRVLLLVGTLLAIFLVLHTFAPETLPPVLTPHYPHHEPEAPLWSSSKWVPPLVNGNRPDTPVEYEADGTCRFLSLMGALSKEERRLAETLELTEVSPGIVSVNNKTAEGAHPILGLLLHGERKWNELVGRQSKTLQQAYDTYMARWGRPPPKGFEDWYHFALDREVLLIDEYDV